MLESSASKTEYLFSLYSKNLSLIDPSISGSFCCPLCLRLFPHEAVASRDITIEHIIPSKIGGKLETLTCRECNNRDGTLLDSQAIQKFRSEDILAGKSEKPLRVKVFVGEGKFTADLYLSEKGNPKFKIVGIPKLSDPNLHKSAIEQFQPGVTDISVTGSLGYRDIQSRVAILRSAYLTMFRYFGYGYILAQTLDPIRAQISEPSQETEVLQGVINLKSAPFDLNSVALITQPSELYCFFVLLDFSTEIERFYGVALPGQIQSGNDMYKRWKNFRRQNPSNIQMNYKLIPYSIDYLTISELKSFSLLIWNTFIKN